MTSTHELRSISDDELLLRLSQILTQSRRVEPELVAHIGEVDERRLYAREACSSMFAYCVEFLHLSEHEAYLRITTARVARRHPMLLVMLGDGRLHLSGIARLAPLLTPSNRDAVLARAAHKSKRQLDELVAELAPKPDVPPVMRKLPNPPARIAPSKPTEELGPDRVTFLPNTEPIELVQLVQPAPVTRPREQVVEPLAPARYRVQFTASAELRDKLARLEAFMRADLAVVIEAAVTEKLERVEAKRFAGTKAPRKSLGETDTSGSSRYIPAAVKRVVCERDGDQCTFVDRHGRRCTEGSGLEFHHRDPFGLGGDHSPENVFLMCHAHNVYRAELDYGRKTMDKYRRPGRVSEPEAVYFAAAPPTEFNRVGSNDVRRTLPSSPPPSVS